MGKKGTVMSTPGLVGDGGAKETEVRVVGDWLGKWCLLSVGSL